MSNPKETVNGNDSREASPNDTSAGAKKGGKKYDRSIDHVLKALSSLETPEEKLAALCKKYADQLEEQRVSQQLVKQTQRKLAVVTREKEQLQNEHSKAVLAKSKLEGLCRELQKHSKSVKDESVARVRGEEEKRKEVSAKFQNTISEIQSQMQQNHERNTKLKEENAELAGRLKKLIEQYEIREQHVEKIMQHKDIENQLAEAKLKQSELQGKEEKEIWLKEKQILLKNLTEAHSRMETYEKNELTMKAQITVYNQKYEEFQTTLAKSSEVFHTWKADMDAMTKRMKKLEKETRQWKTRWENTNRALIEMVDQKTTQDENMKRVQLRCNQMEKLCRAMQAERKGDGDVADQIEEILSMKIPEVQSTPLTQTSTALKQQKPAGDDRGRARARNNKPATVQQTTENQQQTTENQPDLPAQPTPDSKTEHEKEDSPESTESVPEDTNGESRLCEDEQIPQSGEPPLSTHTQEDTASHTTEESSDRTGALEGDPVKSNTEDHPQTGEDVADTDKESPTTVESNESPTSETNQCESGDGDETSHVEAAPDGNV